jgi:hypothetical protein
VKKNIFESTKGKVTNLKYFEVQNQKEMRWRKVKIKF